MKTANFMELPKLLMDQLKVEELVLVRGGGAREVQPNNGSGLCSGPNNDGGRCGGSNNAGGRCGD